MRSLSRLCNGALMGAVLLTLAGCGGDNEDFVKAQQAANAGKGDAPSAGPAPKNQQEYFQRQQQQQQQNLKKSGYPGAK